VRERLLAAAAALVLTAGTLAVALASGESDEDAPRRGVPLVAAEPLDHTGLLRAERTARAARSRAAQPRPAAPAPTAAPSAAPEPKPPAPAPPRAPAPEPPARTQPAPAPPPAVDGRAAYEDRLLAGINAERRRRALPALTADRCADRYADAQAERMAARRQMAHQDLAPVLAGCDARKVAENVGEGDVDPDRMVALWMGSAPHRANVLDPELTAVGTGAVRGSDGRWYACQVFLAR
jgi:uncharacterized protein YkwD